MNAFYQSGITWGDRSFSEPVALVSATPGVIQQLLRPAGLPGLYVDMVQDPTWSPKRLRPVYFGQSDDIYGRATPNHEKFLSWCVAANGNVLYVSYSPMFGSCKADREAAETVLIEKYAPACNQKLSMNPLRMLMRASSKRRPPVFCSCEITSKRFRAWGFPLGPSMRMRLFADLWVRLLSVSKPMVALM
jgi:hypothetical protein